MLINFSYQNSIFNNRQDNNIKFCQGKRLRNLSEFEKILAAELKNAIKRRDANSISRSLDRIAQTTGNGSNLSVPQNLKSEFQSITSFLKNYFDLSKDGHENCLQKFLSYFKKYDFNVPLRYSRMLSDIQAKYVEQGGKKSSVIKNIQYLLSQTGIEKNVNRTAIKRKLVAKRNLTPLTPAERKLVEENIGLVKTVVNRYKKLIGRREQDCFQEGFWGLINAVKFYRPEIGRFSTYAYNCIKFYIKIYFQRDTTIILPKSPTQQVRVQKDFREFINKGLGYGESIEKLAKKHNIPAKRVERLLESHNPFDMKIFSTESLVDERTKLKDIIVDENAADPKTEAINAERRELLEKALSRLSERERIIVNAITGFNGRKKAMAEISEEVGGISQQRISQIYRRALKKLRCTKDGNNPLRDFLD